MTTKPATPKPVTTKPAATRTKTAKVYTEAEVSAMLKDAHTISGRKWESAVNALVTLPMAAWAAILIKEQERVGSSGWNGWINGFKPELKKHGWEFKTTRNARSGNGEFTFRTLEDGKTERAAKSAQTRAKTNAEAKQSAAETVVKAAGVTVEELVKAVLTTCETAGLNPADIVKGIQEATKPPRVPRPSRRRKTAPEPESA